MVSEREEGVRKWPETVITINDTICIYWKVLECSFDPWVSKVTWRRAWQPTPVLLPEESHAQRSLVGYSPWGCKESYMTEQLNWGGTFSIPGLRSSPGGDHGNPLQYSCLKNLMHRGAWRATVHSVAKNWHDWSDLACTHAYMHKILPIY